MSDNQEYDQYKKLLLEIVPRVIYSEIDNIVDKFIEDLRSDKGKLSLGQWEEAIKLELINLDDIIIRFAQRIIEKHSYLNIGNRFLSKNN